MKLTEVCIVLIFMLGSSIALGKTNKNVFEMFKTNRVAAQKLAQQDSSVEIDGVLETLCSVSKDNKKVVFMHFILQADGTRQEVYFGDTVKVPEPGTQIKVKKAFRVRNNKKQIKALYIPEMAQNIQASPVVAASQYNALGSKNVMVALINYSDKPGYNNATAASYAGIYNTLRTGYLNQSFNNISINSTIMDKVAVSMPSTHTCDGNFLYAVIKEVQTEATKRGFNTADYQHFQIVLPSTNSCGWCGLGSVFGPYTWINACNSYSTVGHELGHNFGMMHGNLFSGCDANWRNCTNQEYGDGADLMGVAEGEFTSVHKDKSAWFDGTSNNPRTQLITASGTYTIEPLETLTSGLKVLKFERASGEFYYVEYRQPINFDKNINSTYHKSLGIHFGTSNSTASWRLKTIGVGASFVDAIYPNGGLSIKLLSYNASGAQVQVDIGSIPPPVTPTPTVVPTKTVVPTVVPTKTVNPTVVPTVTPTQTPPPPPGSVIFNVSPGQWVYKYDPTRTIWSSVSVWINQSGRAVVNAPTNYRVYTPTNKLYRELNKNTDTSGYIKFGLPIDKTTTVGKYKVVIKTTINKIVYTSEPTYFEVK